MNDANSFYSHEPGQLSYGAVLDVGLKCSHSCKFCYYSYMDGSADQFRGMRKAKFRTTKDLKRTLYLLKKAGFINFDVTGGEPTLHPEITELMRYAHKDLGLYGRIITLCQFLTQKRGRKQLRLITELIDAGTINFLLSLHATNEDLFKKITGGSFLRQRSAMDYLDKKGFQYCSNTTVFEWNYKTLPDIAKEILNHEIYLHNFIIMNAYYQWNKGGKAFGVQAKYSEIFPYLSEAVSILEDNDIAVNIRYAPMCAVKGFEKNLVGVLGVRYDPYEWMNRAGHFGGTPEHCSEKYQIAPGEIEKEYAYHSVELKLENGTAITGMRGKHFKYFSRKCHDCAAKYVCDGVDPNYLSNYGDNELIPYDTSFGEGPVASSRLTYTLPFMVKTAQYFDMKSLYKKEICKWHQCLEQKEITCRKMSTIETMSRDNSFISVVIPSYNYGHFLEDAVNSVIAQTFNKLEIIIVNDGSTDNTKEVADQLKTYWSDYPISIINQENSGQPAISRNKGISKAKGNYILCLDADDMIDPTMLEECLNVFNSDKSVSIVYTDRLDFDGIDQVVQAGEYNFQRLKYENHISYCALYKKEIWDKIGGYRTNIKGAEDWDFWIAAGAKGFYGQRIPKALFKYRRHDTGLFQEVIKNFPKKKATVVLNNSRVYSANDILEAKRILHHKEPIEVNSNPLISVIIPTYNRPEMLYRAIRSVLEQSYKHYEIIVVNDGGIPVHHIIRNFYDNKRISYIEFPENRERSAARNAAIKISKGKYIAYLDDDDIYYQIHLECLVSFLEKNNFKIAYTDAYRAHYNKQKGKYIFQKKDLPYSFDFDNDRMIKGNFIPILCVMHEKQCFKYVGLFDEKLASHEDWDLWIRMSRKYKFNHIRKITAEYSWMTDGSTTTSGKQEDMLRTRKMIYDKYNNSNRHETSVAETKRETQGFYRTGFSLSSQINKCSIIIPVFNQLNLTKQCVTALHNCTLPNLYELIIIDNDSTDGTSEYLEILSNSNKIKVLTNRNNKGFAKACNQGVRMASCDYVLFLNSDTVPQYDWLKNMVQTVEKDSNIGIVGSRLLYPNGSVQHAGIYFKNGIPYHKYRGLPKDHPAVIETKDVPAVTGACLLIAKKHFLQVGGFDESYHMYVEDVDLCLKIWDAGYRVVYCASSVVVHHESASVIDISQRDAQVRRGWQKLINKWRNRFPKKALDLLSEGNNATKPSGDEKEKSKNQMLPIVWNAPIFDPSGYADEARNFILQLKEKKFNIATREIGRHSENFYRELNKNIRNQLDQTLSLKPESDFINVIHFPAYAFKRLPQASYNIGRVMFETNGLPTDWVAKCNQMDEIWVPSDFNMETFRKAGVTASLTKVPGGIDTAQFKPGAEPLPIPNLRKTVFSSMFEWLYRKGWDRLLDAWSKAFGPDDDVTLLLRTYPINDTDITDAEQEIENRIDAFLQTKLGLKRHDIAPIILLGEQIAERDLPRFYATGDVYVSCSRGEGWGRPQMQAMACGLPVIATNWSGNLEFMNAENSLLLDIKGIVNIDDRMEIPFYRGQKWAEPSTIHLSKLMQWVSQNPTQAEAIGKKARQDMIDKWQWQKIVRIPAQRLQEIQSHLQRTGISINAQGKPISVRWEGSQFVYHSLALVNRELCVELSKSKNIELSLIPYEPHQFDAGEDIERFEPIAQRLNKALSSPVEFHIRHQWPPNFTPPSEGHWIMIQPWEYGSLPKDWVKPMETMVDELWVPSNHVRNVYIQSGISAAKVVVVHNGVNYDHFNPKAKKYILETNKQFKFLFVGGTILRKGIDILLSAYKEAFSPADNVCLVVKDMGGDSFYKGQSARSQILAVQGDPNAPELLYITGDIRNSEIAGLYTACDCLVHPYRGEGFGLPVAEAMACGLPVIVTRGGACDDFCCEDTAFFIKASIVPVQPSGVTLSGPGWALNPDKDHLVHLMKQVYTHRTEAEKIGAQAAAEIRKRIGWRKSAQIIEERLSALRKLPIRRFNVPGGKLPVEAAEKMYTASLKLVENGAYEEAIVSMTGVTKKYPSFAAPYNDLGVLEYKRGDIEKAQAFYQKAVEIEPSNVVYQKNLADFYCAALGKIEAAMGIYVNVLKQNPYDTEALLAMGHVCRKLERFEDADSFYRRVLETDSDNEIAHNFLKNGKQATVNTETSPTDESAYHELSQTMVNDSLETTIQKISAFLAAFPDFALAHNDLGALCQRAGEIGQAQIHYEKAAALQADNTEFQKNLADFYFVELDRKAQALEIYRKLLQKHPDDTTLLLMAGHICVALKQIDDAETFYRKLLSVDPTNPDVRTNLEHIERLKDTQPSDEKRPAADLQVTDDPKHKKAAELKSDPAPHVASEHQQLVSILVPASGPVKQLRRCIQAIERHTPESHEIIFIDSGITRGCAKWLKTFLTKNDHCRMVRCKHGSNMATVFNAGIAASQGELIVRLSSDVEVTPGWLSGMIGHLEHTSHIGIIGPMTNICESCQKVPAAWNKTLRALGAFAADYRQTNHHRRIISDTVDSFCMLMRRNLIEKIGLFDEKVGQGNYESEDLCLRSELSGHQNLIAGDVYIHRWIKKQPVRSKKSFNLKWSSADAKSTEGKQFLALSVVRKAYKAWQAERIEEAGELFLQAIGINPEYRQSYHKLAEMLIQTRQLKDALQVLDQLPKGPSDIEALVLLASCEEGIENYGKARMLSDQLLDIAPNKAATLNIQGILAYHKGDLLTAAEWFQRAISNDPGFADAYTNLGTLKSAAGEDSAAMDLYERGFILSPTTSDIATAYHEALAAQNAYQRAEPLVRDASIVYTQSKKIRYMLIDILIHLQKHAEAMDTIEGAIANFGVDDGILAIALKIREMLGPLKIDKHRPDNPTVSLCMIVKNEQATLARCLRSAKPVVDEIIVVDTGSTDCSADIARAFGAKVYSFTWTEDFSAARNHAISRASGNLIFLMDADEVISPIDYDSFRRLVRQSNRKACAYIVNTRNYNMDNNLVEWVANEGHYGDAEAGAGWTPSAKIRLFPNDPRVHFEFPVHEMVEPSLENAGIPMRPCNIQIHHYGKLNREKTVAKGEAYYDIGRKKLAETKDSPVALRELAVQAEILKKHDEAIELWKRFITLVPNDPKAYINMGVSYCGMGKFDKVLATAEKVLQLLPNSKEGQYNYALAKLHLGYPDQAFERLEGLCQKMPEYLPARFLLSATNSILGKKESGMIMLDELSRTAIGPGLAIRCHELAKDFVASNIPDYALAILDAAIDSKYSNQAMLNLYADCLKQVDPDQKTGTYE